MRQLGDSFVKPLRHVLTDTVILFPVAELLRTNALDADSAVRGGVGLDRGLTPSRQLP